MGCRLRGAAALHRAGWAGSVDACRQGERGVRHREGRGEVEVRRGKKKGVRGVLQQCLYSFVFAAVAVAVVVRKKKGSEQMKKKKEKKKRKEKEKGVEKGMEKG